MKLVRYDAACRALALALKDAQNINEAKAVRDAADGLITYAKRAKNKILEADAWEIRQRSERLVGRMMAHQDKNKGGRPTKNRVSEKPGLISYSEAGIDKNLAHRARTLANMADKDFAIYVRSGRDDVRNSVERSTQAKIDRAAKHQAIAAKAAAQLSNFGPFPILYADPPWKWGHFGDVNAVNEKGKA